MPIANEVDRLPEKSEHDVQSTIIENCKARGAVVIRINAGGSISKRGGHIRLAPKGTADTFILYKSVAIFCEVKKPGEKPTAKQIEFLESVARAGGVGLLAYDSEFVDMALVNIDYGGVEEVRGLSCGIWEPNRIFISEAK